MKYTSKRKTFTLLRCLSFLLLLALLSGCQSYTEGSRPTENTSAQSTAATTDPSIPSSGTPSNKKRVAITFDDGPQCRDIEYGPNTKMIVDELNKYGFHATFFLIGKRIDASPDDTLPYIVQNGNEIGIHSYNHTNSSDAYYNNCTEEYYQKEINQTRDAILRMVPGYEIKTMRPVGGHISTERVKASPYSVINWDVDSEDYKYTYSRGDSDEQCAAKVNTIVQNVMSNVRDGSIILLHDIYESTYDATVIILQRLYEEGYEVVSVSELLGSKMQPGRLYLDAYSI